MDGGQEEASSGKGGGTGGHRRGEWRNGRRGYRRARRRRAGRRRYGGRNGRYRPRRFGDRRRRDRRVGRRWDGRADVVGRVASWEPVEWSSPVGLPARRVGRELCFDSTRVLECVRGQHFRFRRAARDAMPCTAPSGGTRDLHQAGPAISHAAGATPKKCQAAGICISFDRLLLERGLPHQRGRPDRHVRYDHARVQLLVHGSTKSCTTGSDDRLHRHDRVLQQQRLLGTCMKCDSTTHACVAAKSADDPNGRCAGTCDAAGACKSKQGQTCNTGRGGCVSGTTCSPDGVCCDTACTGSCVACDIAGHQGTCTNLSAGATPHSDHTACGGTGTCAGSCGSNGTCSFPTSACGSATCSSTTAVTAAGTCSNGSCVKPAAQSLRRQPHLLRERLQGHVCGAIPTANPATSARRASATWVRQRSRVDPPPTPARFAQTERCICWGDNSWSAGHRQLCVLYHPSLVQLTKPAIAISGGQSACALLNDGTVACWGDNAWGQLGNGSFTASPTPVPVQGFLRLLRPSLRAA